MNNNKPIKIIQCSPTHSGSTPMVNIIYGMIHKELPISHFYIKEPNYSLIEESETIVIKTHWTDVEFWMKKFSEVYDLYFIITIRNNQPLQEKYSEFKNVLCFEYYTEILETKENSLDNIVDNVYNKLYNFLPSSVNLDKNGGMERIINMNSLYEKIKHKPFSYYDKFYHLHGSHRNRDH